MKLEPVGAFLPYEPVDVESAESGTLTGLTFGVKDLFNVAGYPTGAGHPAMLRRSGEKRGTAPLVQQLLDAGARFVGKTVTDELAFSLSGRNRFYGTPRNGAAPGRLPGGSSSGSAAAVANGLCDFALGTDTAGSVRLPASYQGLWGWRATHGQPSLAACQPLAPSFDAVGVFTRDAATLQRVAEALSPLDEVTVDAGRLKVATDAFALVRELEPPRGAAVTFAPDGFDTLVRAARALQGREAWATYSWLSGTEIEELSAPVRNRLLAGRDMLAEELTAAEEVRAAFCAYCDTLLADGGPILLPTVDAPAPLLSATDAEVDAARAGALRLLYPASLAGLPQVSMPLATVYGLPMGLSLIGPRGSDRSLIRAAAAFAEEFVS